MPARRFTVKTSEFDYALTARGCPEHRMSAGRHPGCAVPATLRTCGIKLRHPRPDGTGQDGRFGRG
jgi:hypothetical protein